MLSSVELEKLTSPTFIGNAIRKTQLFVLGEIESNPDAFKTHWIVGKRGTKKPMAWVDAQAENFFKNLIRKQFSDDVVHVLGEESLEDHPRLQNDTRTCVIVDMIDGTDLLQRDFGNWCSAVVVCTPLQRRIDAGYVAIRSVLSNTLYYAIGDRKPKRLVLSETRLNLAASQLKGPRAHCALDNASICTYGQKHFAVSRLSEVCRALGEKWLGELQARDKELRNSASGEIGFRLYNFAGNPMMARLADGIVDAVIELGGQMPHDVVPGAFIALRAGASLRDIHDREITVHYLGESLLDPAGNRLKYVLAANPALQEEIQAHLNVLHRPENNRPLDEGPSNA